MEWAFFIFAYKQKSPLRISHNGLSRFLHKETFYLESIT